jgi:hypothetical protein
MPPRRYALVVALALALVAPLLLHAAPIAASSKVVITLNCTGSPETTKIKNNTSAQITITSVGSLYKPRTNEPFALHQSVSAGHSITYQTGSNAVSHVLTHQAIYANGVSSEGVRVKTSVGTFTKLCP